MSDEAIRRGFCLSGVICKWRSANAVRRRKETGSRWAVVVLAAMLSGVATAAVPTSERSSLEAFYHATAGSTWANHTGWLGPAGTECAWFGVACNEEGDHVTSIELPYNHLVGTIAAELCDLRKLRTLDLSRNYYLTGGFPELDNCDDLLHLDVSNSSMSGSLKPITHLTKLAYFDAVNNSFSGEIPDISGLTALSYFALASGDESHPLSGDIPPIDSLHQLTHFFLVGNAITGRIPDLTGLTSLEWVQIAGDGLVGTVPEIAGLSNLQYFDISGAQLAGALPAISALPNLQVYRVHDAHLVTASIPPIDWSPSLREIAVQNLGLLGEIPDLSNAPNLQILNVRNNRLSGQLPDLSGLPGVVSIDVSNNALSGALPSLQQFHDLQRLVARNNHFSGALASFNGLHELVEVNVSFNALSGELPATIAGLPYLVRILVDHNQFVGAPPTVAQTVPLADAASLLCPNNLDPIPSDRWDRATALNGTSWYDNCGSIGQDTLLRDGFDRRF